MKTINIRHTTILILSMFFFIACSNDDNHVTAGPVISTNGDAVLYNYRELHFKDSLTLQIILPSSTDADSDEEQLYIYTGFYNSEGDDQWYPIPGVRTDKDYQIYREHHKDTLNPNLVNLSIYTKKVTSREFFGNTLSFDQLKIVAVNSEALRGLTPADLDLKDYQAVMVYFGLDP
ncbi:hypothetical protein SAMN02927921_02354 [Sinomicrobium oceani]|uniref:Uncharacterized protein n=1 Tax=Sinomicrobium oceani TaxID=1150368 RepID=A0A1K1QBD2_9FLAO|nr:hypothetical protein [Sinomicrobium oceani]SFW56510.1 hypothetical protein SAMN02927921_02354 [Sinomicrobium oceani]